MQYIVSFFAQPKPQTIQYINTDEERNSWRSDGMLLSRDIQAL